MQKFAGIFVLLILSGAEVWGGDYQHEGEVSPEIDASVPQEPAQAPVGEAKDTVASNLEVARDALQEEVRKGNLPQSAVAPLLAKIGPVIDRIAGELNAADGNQELIQEILRKPREIDLEGNSQFTQLISQVLNATSGGAGGIVQTSPNTAVVVVQREVTGVGPAFVQKNTA